MAKKPLVKRSTDGRTYQCVLDGANIPDGAWVQGTWDTNGNVTGVRATRSGNVVLHSCGTITGLTTKWSGPTDG